MTNLNGTTWALMLKNGANNLYNHFEECNNLNVFPIPDGDTGTNINLTMNSAVKEIESIDDSSIDIISGRFSKGALLGARGNSGVILSQIFRGFSLAFQKCKVIDVKKLINGFVLATKNAYESVGDPIEGTILTVMRECSEELSSFTKEPESIIEVFEIASKKMEESLENTPNLLPILKECNVVDSGGFGLMKIINGMKSFLQNDIIVRKNNEESSIKNNTIINAQKGYGYCTEFIIKLKNKNSFNKKVLYNKLEKLGDSIVLVHDDNIVKVHIHTLKPGYAMNLVQRFGEFVNIKIDNMELQAERHILDYSVENKEVGIIAVCDGSGIKSELEQLGVDLVIDGGQTLNPSVEDFTNAISNVKANKIIIFPNNSNIIMAAKKASSIILDKDVEVIESKSMVQSIGAMAYYSDELSFEQNIESFNEYIENSSYAQITIATKSIVIDNVKITKGEFISIYKGKIVSCFKKELDALESLVNLIIENKCEHLILVYGKKVKRNEKIEKMIEKNNIGIEYVYGDQLVYKYIIGIE